MGVGTSLPTVAPLVDLGQVAQRFVVGRRRPAEAGAHDRRRLAAPGLGEGRPREHELQPAPVDGGACGGGCLVRVRVRVRAGVRVRARARARARARVRVKGEW